ncbi:hypothetical protein OG689_42000 [Kitasatospora sp. NBC_00240]|uniref:HPr family phosphocarrier protein n=1 Tax=Kitasatospora sp. NBC_00240 TaxID=2903567 RepID=UPI002258AC16|nr:hypothetical protein [Kitasatospora sp. NBC_00240]MCX5215732.1 hypothetical protein [Kitasatospora sp. NBC_00240]
MTLDQVLFTNSKHARDSPLEERATGILGAWLAGRGDGTRHTAFDPNRIAAVIGTAHGRVIGAYDTVEGGDGKVWEYFEDTNVSGRQRVKFHGRPSAEFAQLVGQPSPVTWVRGERSPVKVMELGALRELYSRTEPVTTESGPAQRAVVGGATVTADADGNLTVDAPAGVAVTVRTGRTAETPPPSAKTGPPRIVLRSEGSAEAAYIPNGLVRLIVEHALSGFDEEILKGTIRVVDPSGDEAFGREVAACMARLRAAGEREAKGMFELLGQAGVQEVAEVIERRLAGVLG